MAKQLFLVTVVRTLIRTRSVMITISNLTESAITWEADLWTCLWEVILIALRAGDLAIVGGTISGWELGLCERVEKHIQSAAECIIFCFLIVDAM